MVEKTFLHYEVLDKARKEILPGLVFLKNKFYLGAGTALALRFGHRVSEDFDYFTNEAFDNGLLFSEFEARFKKCSLEKTQEAKDTLSFIIDQTVKFSFFRLSFFPVEPLIETEYFYLLSLPDIAAMKIAALTRAVYRDYVDIYFILQKYSLNDIFRIARLKYKNFDEGLYLKCLLSYADVEVSPVKFKRYFKKEPRQVYSSIEKKVREYLKEHI